MKNHKSELAEVYMALTPQQKKAFHEEAELRGGMRYLDEVLAEAHELGLRPSQRVSGDSPQRVSEGAQIVQLMAVRGGLL